MKSLTHTLSRVALVSLMLISTVTPLAASAAVTIGGVNVLDPLGLFSGGGKGSIGLSIGGGGGGIGLCSNTICSIGATLIYIINSILVPLLFAVAFIMFLYGVAKTYIFSHGDSTEVGEGHRLILWGIIGFAVMISLWGLVNIVANTFGLGGYSAPPTPTSY